MPNNMLVLLVDDEPMIQMAMQDALEQGGFTVLIASDGVEAMAVLEDETHEIEGLVTDIRLGEGPDGWALAQRARELDPEMSVVYISGDSTPEWSARGVPRSMALQKPFASALLVTAIATLLNERGSAFN